jgi:hypothetical protein
MPPSEPYRVSFSLPGLPATTNSGGRTHWAVKVKEANMWKRLVGLAASNKRPLKPLKKAKLMLVRYSSSECDFDGLVSSFKHIIDGLVESGILENDKPSNIGQSQYLWEKAPPKNGRIFVAVEEVVE